ncbi:hypothetical protein AAFF_G00184850 [Aldrovandia affinis]|uniref:Uncharacterized protein n=1 Tax=Aldrovandia affinis TaxID=143900 RepID=A0AAD7RJR9_9TELE|nr:hypothetical protein AAFF_G00184850 [Aldrovandia affinis]
MIFERHDGAVRLDRTGISQRSASVADASYQYRPTRWEREARPPPQIRHSRAARFSTPALWYPSVAYCVGRAGVGLEDGPRGIRQHARISS